MPRTFLLLFGFWFVLFFQKLPKRLDERLDFFVPLVKFILHLLFAREDFSVHFCPVLGHILFAFVKKLFLFLKKLDLDLRPYFLLLVDKVRNLFL